MRSAVLPEAAENAARAHDLDLAVTVIMPVRNEGPHMRDSLEGVLRQETAPDDFEVLVVDGRSSDETPDIVRDIMSRHRNVRLLDNPGRIVPTILQEALVSGAPMAGARKTS